LTKAIYYKPKIFINFIFKAAIVTIDDDEEIGPLPGFTNLQLVDPVKARQIMAAESKSLDDLVRVSFF